MLKCLKLTPDLTNKQFENRIFARITIGWCLWTIFVTSMFVLFG